MISRIPSQRAQSLAKTRCGAMVNAVDQDGGVHKKNAIRFDAHVPRV
jgi:hypothetical protein